MRFARLDVKRAEACDGDAVTLREAVGDRGEDGVDVTSVVAFGSPVVSDTRAIKSALFIRYPPRV